VEIPRNMLFFLHTSVQGEAVNWSWPQPYPNSKVIYDGLQICRGWQLNGKVNLSQIVLKINMPTSQRTIIMFTLSLQPLASTISNFMYNS
jgi:hypothetical protein